MTSDKASAGNSSDVSPVVRRGQRGPGQEVMDILVGEWDVNIEIYVAGNSREHPATGKLISTRMLKGNGRFLQEQTQGAMDNGSEYWRNGTLGYSNIDEAYEWITQDGINANMMFYRSECGTRPGFPISMSGDFTDPGLLGEAYVGKPLKQRTQVTIVSPDRHTIDLFFQAPAEQERFAVHMDYSRR